MRDPCRRRKRVVETDWPADVSGHVNAYVPPSIAQLSLSLGHKWIDHIGIFEEDKRGWT
jgi:hypothetical protein